MTPCARVLASAIAVAVLACPPAAAGAARQGHAAKPDPPAAKPAQAAKPDARANTPAQAAKPDAHAAPVQAPPSAGDPKPGGHGPAARPQAAAPAAGGHGAKTPAAPAGKTPPASKPGEDSPSVDDVVKRINAILAEGPGTGTSKKDGPPGDRDAVAPAKPRGATRVSQPVGRGTRKPPSQPGPSGRGIVLTWDPALTRRGVTLVWDPELTLPAEPAVPGSGIRLRWSER